jgi:hypothetical protein
LFRTAKYRPVFPQKGFTDLTAARQWASGSVAKVVEIQSGVISGL